MKLPRSTKALLAIVVAGVLLFSVFHFESSLNSLSVAPNVRDSATWRFLAGGNNEISPEANVQLLQEAGANGVYSIPVFPDCSWESSLSVPVGYGGMSQASWSQAYSQDLHNAGMICELQMNFWAYYSGDDGYSSSAAMDEAYWQNTNGLADQLISNVESIIQYCHPDIIQLYNEPMGTNPDGSTNYMPQYIDLCNRMMQAYEQAAGYPLTFVVMGCPFWQLDTINKAGFSVPSGCTLIESLHYYYDWNGLGYSDIWNNGQDIYPQQNAYWNNPNWSAYGDGGSNSGNPLTQSQEASAKAGLDSMMNNYLALTQSNGFGKFFCEESGGCLTNPNIGNWCSDFWGWCVSHSIGFDALDEVVPYTQTWPDYCRDPGAVFNADGSLNTIGQSFAQYTVGSPAPTSTPTPIRTPTPAPTQQPYPTQTPTPTWQPNPTPAPTLSDYIHNFIQTVIDGWNWFWSRIFNFTR